jgi:hypothetical protein
MRSPARNVLAVTGVHEERRKIRRPLMSPSSISRLCAGVAITLVLFVVVTGAPATAQTHALIQAHA